MNTYFFDYEPGDRVKNPKAPEWGIGQVQSIIKNKVTVNFEDAGKKTVDGSVICLLYTSPSPRDLSTSRMPSSA